jgi:hypothetical protein
MSPLWYEYENGEVTEMGAGAFGLVLKIPVLK